MEFPAGINVNSSDYVEIRREALRKQRAEYRRQREGLERLVDASPTHAREVKANRIHKAFHKAEETAPKDTRQFMSPTPGETYVPAGLPSADNCTHKFRRVGYINRKGSTNPKTETATCENPVMYQCRFCLLSYNGNCGSRVATDCSKCEARYRNDVRLVCRQPMLVAKPGTPLFGTLTGPGAERHCLAHTYKDKKGMVQPSVKCDWERHDNGLKAEDGRMCRECPCSINNINHPDDMAVFNSCISRKFNDFVTELRRSVPGFEGVQYFRAIEPQKRGALHIHVVFIVKRAIKIDALLRATMTAIALRLGFGHQFDLKRVEGDELEKIKTARYIAKYVSKTDGHGKIPFWDEAITYEVVEGSMMIREVPRRRPNTWSSSRGWGMSMKRIKSQRAIFRRSGAEEAQQHLEEGKNGLGRLRDWQAESEVLLDPEDMKIAELDLSLLIK